MGRYRIRYREHEIAIPLGGFVIGRLPECDFRLSGAHVSRRHACICVEDNALVLEDLGSRNGVLLNGQPIHGAVRVAHGDVINIGLDVITIVDELVEPPTKIVITDLPPPSEDCEIGSDVDEAHAITAMVRLEALSKREREVFDLMAQGLTHREIAAKLFVSVKTVETHRTHIGEKLGCRNLREIMHVAFVGGALRARSSG